MTTDTLTERRCAVCGCTDLDCSQCVEKTGAPCAWLSDDLCTACAGDVFWAGLTAFEHGLRRYQNPYRTLPETRCYAADWDKGYAYAQRLAERCE